MVFPTQDMADMHYVYGLADGNGRLAQRMFRNRFPGRHVPHYQTFASVHQRFSENADLNAARHNAGRPRSTRSVNLEERVLQMVDINPSISTRRLGQAFNVSQSSTWRILNDDGLYPYHLQPVQALQQNDPAHRLRFCQWLTAQPNIGRENFAWRTLFTDEAQFTRDGINNLHNEHVYAHENPRAIVRSHHQQRFDLNVWGGIFGNQLFGPVFLPNRLNGESYRNFLRDDLPNSLEDTTLAMRQRMWFMHDGAPAHFSIVARDQLNASFPNRWIGRSGPVQWPARSPDLNPLDFFFWGHCKDLVYHEPINDVDELRGRIVDAFDNIRESPNILRNVNRNMTRRTEACIAVNGENFEQLLH